MCIIIWKPHDVELPDKSLLEMCEYQNDDGAGIAKFNTETQMWDVKKGLMSWADFEKAYDMHNFTKEDQFILHFRFSTGGNKDGGNTHPFIIGEDLSEMRKTEYSAKCIAFHNGVVGSGDKKYSDTQLWVKNHVSKMLPFIHEDSLWKIFGMALKEDRNRWVITDGPLLYMFGEWIEEYGIWWSNDYFKCDRTYKNTSPGYYDSEKGKFDIDGWKKQKNQYSHKWGSKTPTSRWDRQRSKSSYIYDSWEDYWEKDCRDAPETTPKSKYKKLAVGDTGELSGSDLKYILEFIPKYEALVTDDGEIVFQTDESQEKEDENFLAKTFCPSCEKGDDIMDSPFTIGDAYCKICGCIFESGSGEIKAFDPDFIQYKEIG